MSEGGEARNHETEREAVARAIAKAHGRGEMPGYWLGVADAAIEALDAVRRSRQGGHWECLTDHSGEHDSTCLYVPPQGEDHVLMAPDPDVSGVDDYEGQGGAQRMRSPQGEDHERVSQEHDPGRTD